MSFLGRLPALRRTREGVASICTAHPVAIATALRHGKANDASVLIEATCNQVNQDGGYTGMTPAGFRRFVVGIAERAGFDRNRLILGGDHLGPNPWRHLPAGAAMAKAEALVAAYADAGFAKLHLDASMGCAGELVAQVDEVAAERAARLAAVAEGQSAATPPVYVIGTEVPVPGGATAEAHDLEITRPKAALRTYEAHRSAFRAAGVEGAFERAVGIVVQPGVEFGHSDVIVYEPSEAVDLKAALTRMPGVVFEAHSTDYQPSRALRTLVEDGFAILKVGPWLTFALREALYALDQIAQIFDPSLRERGLAHEMEALMLSEPQHWRSYYRGGRRGRDASPATLQLQRPHSLLLASRKGEGRGREADAGSRRPPNPRDAHQSTSGRRLSGRRSGPREAACAEFYSRGAVAGSRRLLAGLPARRGAAALSRRSRSCDIPPTARNVASCLSLTI